MDQPPETPRAADDAQRRIDRLMSGPIKEQPAVTVFGDDAVTGFTPVPLPKRAPTA